MVSMKDATKARRGAVEALSWPTLQSGITSSGAGFSKGSRFAAEVISGSAGNPKGFFPAAALAATAARTCHPAIPLTASSVSSFNGLTVAERRNQGLDEAAGEKAVPAYQEFVVQSDTSKKQPLTGTVSGGDAIPARSFAHSGNDAPGVLDLAANSAVEGIDQRTLMDVCMDLFGKLEASLITDRNAFIANYFATLVKQDEMATLWTEAAYYEHLRKVVQEEVLPLYDRYCAIRGKLLERTEKRSWPKYCLWAIGICLSLELVFSEGRVLRPMALLPAVLVDGCFGYGLYYLINFRDASALKRARQTLLNSIRELDKQHEVAKRYEVFRTYAGGELLTAELQLLLSSYSTPEEFWKDYYTVRKSDPTTPTDLAKLGIKRFNGFLELHVNGAYSPEARQQRFNALFLLAHKAFILNDREHYVLNHLNPQSKP